MRIDLYTKFLLTVIALALLTIACNSLFQPSRVSADSPLMGMQFAMIGTGGFLAFDGKTGDIWYYQITGDEGKFVRNTGALHVGKMTQPGKPLLAQQEQQK